MKSYLQFNESLLDKDKEFIEDVFVRLEDIGVKVNIIHWNYIFSPKYINSGQIDRIIKDPFIKMDIINNKIKNIFKIKFNDDNLREYFNKIIENNNYESKECLNEFINVFCETMDVCLDQLKNDEYIIK